MTLEFDLNHDAPASTTTDCVVVGAFADNTLTPAGQALDTASGGRIRALLERGDASGKTGKTALLHDLPGVTAPRVLVVGLGEPAKFGVPQYIKATGDAARALKAGPVAHALTTLPQVPVKGRDAAWATAQGIVAADHAAYRYTATRSKKEEAGLAKLAVLGADAQGRFSPAGTVRRDRLAYVLVQSLGLQDAARAHTGDVTVAFDGARYVLTDQDKIPAALRGYVQLALDAAVTALLIKQPFAVHMQGGGAELCHQRANHRRRITKPGATAYIQRDANGSQFLA